jgi:hypothetical protein
MKKTFVWCMLALLLCGMALPAAATGSDLDPEQKGSMTLHYEKNGIEFTGLELSAYRVAQINPDGSFDLIEPYDAYPVNIHGITTQQEWRDVTQTLIGYITADRIQPDHTLTTDETGTAALTDLQSGMYLIRGVTAEHESILYQFEDFLVVLPRQQEDGSYDYDVEAYPKSSQTESYESFSVIKLWKDDGNEANRVDSIIIEIYKDGVLYETVLLSKENDWNYAWTTTDVNAEWHVVERFVADGYGVTVHVHDNTFTVVNVSDDRPVEYPDTGDLLNPWLYVLLMCMSGFVLVLMAVWRR